MSEQDWRRIVEIQRSIAGLGGTHRQCVADLLYLLSKIRMLEAELAEVRPPRVEIGGIVGERTPELIAALAPPARGDAG